MIYVLSCNKITHSTANDDFNFDLLLYSHEMELCRLKFSLTGYFPSLLSTASRPFGSLITTTSLSAEKEIML